MMDDRKLKSLSTWKRYKLNQKRFTNWLQKTADQVLGKDGANGSPSRADARVPLGHMEGLAKIIVTGLKPEEIPYTPIVLLQDVLKLRKQSHKFFTTKAEHGDDEEIRAGNKTHEHTIKVLERVLKTLEDAVGSMKGALKAKKDKDYIANTFASLEVFPSEPQESEEEREALPKRALTSSPQRKKKGKMQKKMAVRRKTQRASKSKLQGVNSKGAEWIDRFNFVDDPADDNDVDGDDDDDDDDDDDCHTFIYCFFIDFNEVRDYIAELWCDYFYDKSQSHSTLAVLHNAACDMFFHMQYELAYTIKHRGWDKSVHLAQTMSTLWVGADIDLALPSSGSMPNDEPNEKIWREALDWIASSACNALQSVVNMSRPNVPAFMIPYNEEPVKYDTTTSTPRADFALNCTLDLFWEALMSQHLKSLSREPLVLPAEPDLMLDLQACLVAKTFHSYMVLSLQLYVDMRHIMEEQVSDACHSMLKNINEACEKLRALCKHRPVDDWHQNAMQWTVNTRKYVLRDLRYEVKKLGPRANGEEPEMYWMFKIDPVRSGLMDFQTRLCMSVFGCEGLCRMPAFLRVLGLYNFFGDDESFPSWPLLDAFAEVHYVEAIWKYLLLEDESVLTVLKQTQQGQDSVLSYAIEEPLDILKDLCRLYHTQWVDMKYRTTRNMSYMENARIYLRWTAKQKANPVDRARNLFTKGLCHKCTDPECPNHELESTIVKRTTRKPGKNIEALETLQEFMELLDKSFFKVDYLNLMFEIFAVCNAMVDDLNKKELLAEPCELLWDLKENEVTETILKEVLKDAIGKLNLNSWHSVLPYYQDYIFS